MLRPKLITFDCDGTLTRFRMEELTQEIYGDRVPADLMPAFLESFRGYRMDEVLGAWKPYVDVLGEFYLLRRISSASSPSATTPMPTPAAAVAVQPPRP